MVAGWAVDLGDIRRQLKGDFGYRTGHWFCPAHEAVSRQDGRPFSRKSGGSGRRVVLATPAGPNATVFARSASVELGYCHDAHDHDGGPGTCCLDDQGWIDFSVPVSVAAEDLNDRTYSCREPDGSQLYVEMDRACGW